MSTFAVSRRLPGPALELLAEDGTVPGGDRDGPLAPEPAPLLAEAEAVLTSLFDRLGAVLPTPVLTPEDRPSV